MSLIKTSLNDKNNNNYAHQLTYLQYTSYYLPKIISTGLPYITISIRYHFSNQSNNNYIHNITNKQ